jgi:hypothetical protein
MPPALSAPVTTSSVFDRTNGITSVWKTLPTLVVAVLVTTGITKKKKIPPAVQQTRIKTIKARMIKAPMIKAPMTASIL